MNLSEHFTLDEFTASQTAIRKGISNEPNDAMVIKLKTLAQKMELIRSELGVPLSINSAYRSDTLNKAIGGSSTSQHCKGEAVDFTARQFGDCKSVCKKIIESGIVFDQLIFEGTWVHISFNDKPRKQVLTAKFSGGRVKYLDGIV